MSEVSWMFENLLYKKITIVVYYYDMHHIKFT